MLASPMISIWNCLGRYPKRDGPYLIPSEGPRKPMNENKSKNPSLPAKVRGWVLTSDLAFIENFLGFLSKIQRQSPN